MTDITDWNWKQDHENSLSALVYAMRNTRTKADVEYLKGLYTWYINLRDGIHVNED